MANAILVIRPYWYSGTWVFDDPAVGLVREPFVAGVPEMIDELVKNIPNAREGFRLLFSAGPFPGYQRAYKLVGEEMGGHWYRCEESDLKGWLCPALSKYFEHAPPVLYAKAEPVAP